MSQSVIARFGVSSSRGEQFETNVYPDLNGVVDARWRLELDGVGLDLVTDERESKYDEDYLLALRDTMRVRGLRCLTYLSIEGNDANSRLFRFIANPVDRSRLSRVVIKKLFQMNYDGIEVKIGCHSNDVFNDTVREYLQHLLEMLKQMHSGIQIGVLLDPTLVSGNLDFLKYANYLTIGRHNPDYVQYTQDVICGALQVVDLKVPFGTQLYIEMSLGCIDAVGRFGSYCDYRSNVGSVDVDGRSTATEGKETVVGDGPDSIKYWRNSMTGLELDNQIGIVLSEAEGDVSLICLKAAAGIDPPEQDFELIFPIDNVGSPNRSRSASVEVPSLVERHEEIKVSITFNDCKRCLFNTQHIKEGNDPLKKEDVLKHVSEKVCANISPPRSKPKTTKAKKSPKLGKKK